MTIQEYTDYANQTHTLIDKMVSFVERSFEDAIPHALPRLLVLLHYWTYIRGDWNSFAELHRPPGIDNETQHLFYKVENDLCERVAKLRKKAGKNGEAMIDEYMEMMKKWCDGTKKQ